MVEVKKYMRRVGRGEGAVVSKKTRNTIQKRGEKELVKLASTGKEKKGSLWKTFKRAFYSKLGNAPQLH